MSQASIEMRLVRAFRSEADRLEISDGWDRIQRRMRWRPYRRATALALAMAVLAAAGLVGIRLIGSEPDEANLIGPNPPTKEEQDGGSAPQGLGEDGSSQTTGAGPRSQTEPSSGQTTSSGVESPEGDLIAYSSIHGGDAEIFLARVGADGALIGEPSNLTRSSSDDRGPVWSPDGRKIAFGSSYRPDHDHGQVYVMNADGSDVRRLHPTPCEPAPGYCDDSYPHWSPDGSWIAFQRSYRYGQPELQGDGRIPEIWVMRSDGSDPKKLANGLLPAWSPDGSQISFLKDDTDVQTTPGCRYPVYRQCAVDLYVMRPDGSDQRSLGVGDVSWASWWPDGNRLALSRQDQTTGKSTIWSVRPDGSGLMQITREEADSKWGDWDPTVSPDGRRIVVERWYTDEELNLEIMNADGSNRKHLTTPTPGAADYLPSFAPRGS